MQNGDGIQMLVLQEFKLWTADAHGDVARIVGSSPIGLEPAVPLLTSIDDRRDVATLRALHHGERADPDPAQRAALDPFVSNWEPPKEYAPRIAERSESPPSYFRLAVTESGINDAEPELFGERPLGLAQDAAATALGLIWVGRPLGTHAGLLILVGNSDGAEAGRPEPTEWPLPLSRQLGVRIYESRA